MTFDITDNLDRKFELGRVVATPGALTTFGPAFLGASIARHMAGDWGDIDADDRELNNLALKNHDRLHSCYKQNGRTLWIITDPVGETGHREVTTFLLPSEY